MACGLLNLQASQLARGPLYKKALCRWGRVVAQDRTEELGLDMSSPQGSAKMLNLRQELWDMEEEEEEEGSSPEDSSAESEEPCCEDCEEEGGRGRQDSPLHHRLWGRPLGFQSCFDPYDSQAKGRSPHCSGHRRERGAEAHPWGRGSPPWDPHLGSWVRDTGSICKSSWCLEQAAAATTTISSSSRTLFHPSFQTFFSASSTPSSSCRPSPGSQTVAQPSGGPLPLVDSCSFFYTDPTLPPGYRIYNRLSASSQEVLRSLPLNTPPPIMCTRPAASAGPRWLSDREYGAVSALLILPTSVRGDASSCPAPGAAACGETGAP